MLIPLLTGVLASVFAYSSSSAYNLPPEIQWSKTYGGGGAELACSVQQTLDGGYMVAGVTMPIYGRHDFWLVKTNPSGDMMWNKTYGGDGRDVAKFAQQTFDGGYIIAGYTESFYGANDWDLWLVKTNSAGDMIWDKKYGGADTDAAYCVQQTNDGGYIVAGYTHPSGASFSDFWLVKTNSAGDMLWNKTYGGHKADYACSVQQTNDGGYIVAGPTYAYRSSWDFLLVKTDSSGNMMWNYTYLGGDLEENEHVQEFSVRQTREAGYIIAGSIFSSFARDRDFWLIKLGQGILVVPAVWNEKTYGVMLSSNSNITAFSFDQANKLINFDVSGLNDTTGFSSVTIPKVLLDAAPEEWIVQVDDTAVDPTITWNTTHTSIFFNYTHTTHSVKIVGTHVISEFPPAIILPIFTALTMLVIVFGKRRIPRKLKTNSKTPFFYSSR